MYKLLLDYHDIDEVKSSDVPFHVCLQFDAAFDFNFPFRPLLEFIRARVSEHAGTAKLVLPDYIVFEDFVVGELKLRLFSTSRSAWMHASAVFSWKKRRTQITAIRVPKIWRIR